MTTTYGSETITINELIENYFAPFQERETIDCNHRTL
jgi:hypothetical protein